MAKYGKKAQDKVERAMHEMKEGKLKSGRSGKKVTNPKQAIAIGLSDARKEGKKVPSKATGTKKSATKKSTVTKKDATKKSTGTKKSDTKKSAAPKKAATKKAANKKSVAKK